MTPDFAKEALKVLAEWNKAGTETPYRKARALESDVSAALLSAYRRGLERAAEIAEENGKDCPGEHHDSSGWISCHYVTAQAVRTEAGGEKSK